MGKKLNWKEAKQLIEKEKDKGLIGVSAGLKNTDMSWANIWYKGKYINPTNEDTPYKGIFASTYDIPTISLFYEKQGQGKITKFEKPCFIECSPVNIEDIRCPDWWALPEG